MKTEESLLYENGRADAYKLLAECYYLPDERLIKMLNSPEKSRVRLYLRITKDIPRMDDIAALKIDYSKLFVGPYRLLAPPYGSIYLEGTRRIMGDSTMDVRDRYRQEGLDINIKEAPDHIIMELEFMYYLIFKQIQAVKDKDSKTAINYLEKQLSFLETHLGRWVSGFAANVQTNAQELFYKNLARTTKSFVEKDLNSLLNRCNLVSL